MAQIILNYYLLIGNILYRSIAHYIQYFIFERKMFYTLRNFDPLTNS